jgi:hypothetical protein
LWQWSSRSIKREEGDPGGRHGVLEGTEIAWEASGTRPILAAIAVAAVVALRVVLPFSGALASTWSMMTLGQ